LEKIIVKSKLIDGEFEVDSDRWICEKDSELNVNSQKENELEVIWR